MDDNQEKKENETPKVTQENTKNEEKVVEKVEKKESEKVKKETKQESKKSEKTEKIKTVPKKVEQKDGVKKKKHRVLKTVLIVIIILLILFLVNFFRSYIIASNISEKQQELEKTTNYSYKSVHYSMDDENDKTTMERYYKDGRTMVVLSSGDSRKIIVWYDEQTREFILLNPKDLVAIVEQDSNAIFGNRIATMFGEGMVKPGCAFMFLISSDQIDEKECYKINWSGATTWINKQDGTIVKEINGKSVINGQEYDDITEWKEWKFNELTDEDLARPNLIGYEITTE